MITVTLPSKRDLQRMEARFGARKEFQELRVALDRLPILMEVAFNSIQSTSQPIGNTLTHEQKFELLDKLEVGQDGELGRTLNPIPIDLASITKLTNQEEYDEQDFFEG